MDDAIQVWDLVAKKSVATVKVPKGEMSSFGARQLFGGWYTSSLVFSPNGRQLATGHPDGNIYIWNLDLPEPKLVPLSDNQIESLWTGLGDTDAGKAWQAVWRLVDSPAEVLPALRNCLKPVAVAPDDITRPLLADLESDSFTNRDAAAKRLRELGMSAESSLRNRLKTNPPLEAQRRIEALLKNIVETPEPLTPDLLRQLRAVAVLARIKSPEARDILEDLSAGAESARLTCAARASCPMVAKFRRRQASATPLRLWLATLDTPVPIARRYLAVSWPERATRRRSPRSRSTKPLKSVLDLNLAAFSNSMRGDPAH